MITRGLKALVILMTLQVARCLQTFQQQPEYTEVNPGKSAVLHCKIITKAGQCSWQKDGFPIGPERDKYEWAGDPDRGDCSLRVLRADLKYDDGLWRCQVTASSFQTQDALRSKPAQLVVRVKPKPPEILYRSVVIPSGRNLTVRQGEVVEVKCSSAGGNPPALIKWFAGEDDLTADSTQQNITDSDSEKTSTAVSVLRYRFRRNQAGTYLRCVALHEAWEIKSADTIVRLDIQYPPEVSVTGLSDRDLEHDVDDAVLECRVDANPAASVLWRFSAADSGRADTFHGDRLQFRPVTRANSGTYSCEAANELGGSAPLSVTLHIKYAPHITRVEPAGRVTVRLFNTTSLECEADGSPEPSYRWLRLLQTPGAAPTEQEAGSGSRLLLTNITYDSRGSYVCVATNVINGEQRSVRAEPVELRVVGPPQLVRRRSPVPVSVIRGREAVLVQVFCADPPPSGVLWQWGESRLLAGQARGRHAADDVTQDAARGCYRARLRITGAVPADEGEYVVIVQNEMGQDRHRVTLQVRGVPILAEPVSRWTMVAIGCAGLLLLITVIALLCNAYIKGKWCFSHKGGFKPADVESEKPDANGHGENGGRNGMGAIPPDALYSGPKKPPPGVPGDYEVSGTPTRV